MASGNVQMRQFFWRSMGQPDLMRRTGQGKRSVIDETRFLVQSQDSRILQLKIKYIFIILKIFLVKITGKNTDP